MERVISKINGIDIVTVEKDGEIFVPIKPICEAIGINYTTQVEKLQKHHILSGSTVPLRGIVAADGKGREMLCLPLRFVYGWLFTISPANVAESVRESVVKYQMECYNALYDHFTGSMRHTIETNNAEIELLKDINAAISDEKAARTRRKKAETALEKLRSERLNPQPSLF